MTLAEYRKFVVVTQGGQDVQVIDVHEHKTGLQGAARITVSGDDINTLQAYH